jgi:hypothetical protein
MTMQAGFEALTSEANEWDDTSDALTTAASTVTGLQLSSSAFSFISFMTGVDSSYNHARQHIEDVLTAGASETSKLADALREVRRDFHSTDQEVVSEVQSVWIPE